VSSATILARLDLLALADGQMAKLADIVGNVHAVEDMDKQGKKVVHLAGRSAQMVPSLASNRWMNAHCSTNNEAAGCFIGALEGKLWVSAAGLYAGHSPAS
jgi:hypothetical protein